MKRSDLILKLVSASVYTTLTIAILFYWTSYLPNADLTKDSAFRLILAASTITIMIYVIIILPGVILFGIPMTFYLYDNHKSKSIYWIIGIFFSASLYGMITTLIFKFPLYLIALYGFGGILTGICMSRCINKNCTPPHASADISE